MSLPVQKDSIVKEGGQIQLIFGPMFSGKSTELIRRLKRYRVAQYEVLIVKYDKDNRYSDEGIATHCGQSLPAIATSSLASLSQKAEQYDVIGIDEGQFFPGLVEWCEGMADRGKVVVVAALDGTFQRRAFSNILELVPLAESVVKLVAVCMGCFRDAAFSKRITREAGVEVIGGADKYMAVCRACYHSPVTVAASPRDRLKDAARKAPLDDVSPAKKILFNPDSDKVSNSAPAL